MSATGTNIVDLDAARAAGVAVTNVPGYSTEAVAELVFALVLHFTPRRRRARRGGQARGLGRLARLRLLHPAARRAGGQDAGRRRQRRDRRRGRPHRRGVRDARGARRPCPGSPQRAARTPLAEALPLADVVSLHCPLTPATRGLVNARFLGALKPSAILHQHRPRRAGERSRARRRAGRRPPRRRRPRRADAGAAARRPPAARTRPPRGPARVVVTPHIGWGTVEARRRLAAEVTENLAAFVRGERRNRVV